MAKEKTPEEIKAEKEAKTQAEEEAKTQKKDTIDVIVKPAYATMYRGVRYLEGAELTISMAQYESEKWKFELNKQKKKKDTVTK